MKTLAAAVPCDDQPIGSRRAATMFHESRYLTSWVTPHSLEIQEKYKKLTNAIDDLALRVVACWKFVKEYPYREFVPSRVMVGGVQYTQDDTWLDPAVTMRVPYLNCFNKAILLASLLRQELTESDVYVGLGNVAGNGHDIGGHAFVYLATGDYIMECTNPKLRLPFIRAEDADIYQSVVFFNDQFVFAVPGASLVMPLGNCCVAWLEDYITARHCHNYFA